MTESDFLGFKDSPCDEHRTCGAYARCLDCMQDCSLNEPCKGCEVTLLKAYIAVLEDRVHGALMPGLTKAEFARRYSLYYGPNEDDWICNVCGSRREAVDVTPSPDAPDMFAPGYCPNRHLHP